MVKWCGIEIEILPIWQTLVSKSRDLLPKTRNRKIYYNYPKVDWIKYFLFKIFLSGETICTRNFVKKKKKKKPD